MAQSTNTHPSCQTEQIIHEKVVQWLRRETSTQIDEIDYDASLFELGIDSLGAATIAAELEQELHKRLNPEVVYELETIRELAEYMDSLAAVSPSRSSSSPRTCRRWRPSPERWCSTTPG